MRLADDGTLSADPPAERSAWLTFLWQRPGRGVDRRIEQASLVKDFATARGISIKDARVLHGRKRWRMQMESALSRVVGLTLAPVPYAGETEAISADSPAGFSPGLGSADRL